MNENSNTSDAAQNNLVSVTTVTQPLDAIPIQIKLASFGIDSELEDDLTICANPLLSNAIGGVRILVPSTDVDRATEILADTSLDKDEKHVELSRICPECGSNDSKPVERPIWIAVLAILTVGALSLLYPWPRFMCSQCRHKWR